MIISHKYKFIYVAVPKTGSCSLEQRIRKMELTGVDVYNKPLPEGGVSQKHTTGLELKRKIDKFDQYFKFAFVRNPYDRAVSWTYFYMEYHQPDINPDNYTFSELIKKCPRWIWETQCEYICDDNDINLMNFTGRFENIQQDFDKACDKIGIAPQQLPHINKSKRDHKHYTEYYDDEAREIVTEKYAKDIEYFGYKFGE